MDFTLTGIANGVNSPFSDLGKVVQAEKCEFLSHIYFFINRLSFQNVCAYVEKL